MIGRPSAGPPNSQALAVAIPVHLIGFWFVLAMVCTANGIVREATYGSKMPEQSAHQVSTLTAMILVGLFVAALSRVWPWNSAREAIIVGGCWLLFTVAFEFLFGHFVAGHSWQRLVGDYNLTNGRLWPVFLVWLAVQPWLNWYVGSNPGRFRPTQ